MDGIRCLAPSDPPSNPASEQQPCGCILVPQPERTRAPSADPIAWRRQCEAAAASATGHTPSPDCCIAGTSIRSNDSRRSPISAPGEKPVRGRLRSEIRLVGSGKVRVLLGEVVVLVVVLHILGADTFVP